MNNNGLIAGKHC